MKPTREQLEKLIEFMREQFPDLSEEELVKKLPAMYDPDELQQEIDTTIKNGVSKEIDKELGLTGRNLHQVITRLASALEKERLDRLRDLGR